MTKVIVDQAIRDKLLNFTEPLELCDESGNVLARLLPAIDREQYEGLEPGICKDELRRRRQSKVRTYTTAEVLDHLENLVVIKRWVGVPLAAVGLGPLDLSGLKEDWDAGRVRIEVVQDVPGFAQDLFPTPLALDASFARIDDDVTFSSSFSSVACPITFSFCPGEESDGPYATSREQIASLGPTASIEGSYILEVRSTRSDELVRMIWVDRDTFLIRKVVAFEDGQRSTTLLVERIDLDQGLTEEEIITLPTRGVETIRG